MKYPVGQDNLASQGIFVQESPVRSLENLDFVLDISHSFGQISHIFAVHIA